MELNRLAVTGLPSNVCLVMSSLDVDSKVVLNLRVDGVVVEVRKSHARLILEATDSSIASPGGISKTWPPAV